MNRCFLQLTLSILLFASANTVHAQASDLARVADAMAQDMFRVMYEATLDRFIKAARAKDVEKMIAITSPISRQQSGDDELRKLYANEYVPLFIRFTQIADAEKPKFVREGTTTEGWIFNKIMSDKDGQSVPTHFVVLKENDIYFVTAFGLGPK